MTRLQPLALPAERPLSASDKRAIKQMDDEAQNTILQSATGLAQTNRAAVRRAAYALLALCAETPEEAAVGMEGVPLATADERSEWVLHALDAGAFESLQALDGMGHDIGSFLLPGFEGQVPDEWSTGISHYSSRHEAGLVAAYLGGPLSPHEEPGVVLADQLRSLSDSARIPCSSLPFVDTRATWLAVALSHVDRNKGKPANRLWQQMEQTGHRPSPVEAAEAAVSWLLCAKQEDTTKKETSAWVERFRSAGLDWLHAFPCREGALRVMEPPYRSPVGDVLLMLLSHADDEVALRAKALELEAKLSQPPPTPAVRAVDALVWRLSDTAIPSASTAINPLDAWARTIDWSQVPPDAYGRPAAFQLLDWSSGTRQPLHVYLHAVAMIQSLSPEDRMKWWSQAWHSAFDRSPSLLLDVQSCFREQLGDEPFQSILRHAGQWASAQWNEEKHEAKPTIERLRLFWDIYASALLTALPAAKSAEFARTREQALKKLGGLSSSTQVKPEAIEEVMLMLKFEGEGPIAARRPAPRF